jgi:hypothetical protein
VIGRSFNELRVSVILLLIRGAKEVALLGIMYGECKIGEAWSGNNEENKENRCM